MERYRDIVNRRNIKDKYAAGINYLFIIGIDEYKHCPTLFNAVSDVKKFRQILFNKYQFDKNNSVSLFNKDATRKKILAKLREFAIIITPEDNLIMYFSGHGEYDKITQEGYWIPVNAVNGEFNDYLPNSVIKKSLSSINSHHTFLISDSCFSGSLFHSGQERNIRKRYEADPSRWGLTSGRNEIVSDGKAGKSSPFSESLLYRLEMNEDDFGVNLLCANVVEQVQANSNQSPIGQPLNIRGHKNGQFVFRLKTSSKAILSSPIVSQSNQKSLVSIDNANTILNEESIKTEMKIYDERVPSLIGIFTVFLGLYLLIACTSYLFTWQEDQDSVLRYSWMLFTQNDLEMANWLGRLGSIVSNTLFYWLVGVPSFIFIFLIFDYGITLFRNKSIPINWFMKRRYLILSIFFFSVLFEFIFSGSTFPWGGGIGESVNSWLHRFAGTPGELLMLLICGMLILSLSPFDNLKRKLRLDKFSKK